MLHPGTLHCLLMLGLWCVSCRPDLVDMERVQIQSNRENLEQAFEIAERLGVTRLLDAEGGQAGEMADAGRCRPFCPLPSLTAFLLSPYQMWMSPLQMRNL